MSNFALGVLSTLIAGGVGLWALTAFIFNTPDDIARATHDRETRLLQHHE